MIVGKDSAKIGFSWFGRTVLKGISSAAVMGLAQDTVTVVIGVMLLVVTVYEGITEWKTINNTKHSK